MHDILWLLLTSLLTGWMMFRTRKEEHFSGKKQVQEIVNKYKLLAEFAGSLFLILLCLLLASAVFLSNGCPETALFLATLYMVALTTATVIHLLCRIRKNWDEHDFYMAMANRTGMSLRHLKQLKFFLLIAACSGLVCSAFRVLPSR